MDNVKKKESTSNKLFFCFMEVNLDLFQAFPLNVDVRDSFEDVSNVRCTCKENSDWFFVLLVVEVGEEVQGRGHAPVLYVSNLIDYFHLNFFK